MVASGRNTEILVFDKGDNNRYKMIHRLRNCHSSRVWSVRFLESENQLYLASCGADKKFILHEEQTVSAIQTRILWS